MLYILFGSTAEMGKYCRDYFASKGFENIEKLNYIPKRTLLTTIFGERKKATRKQVEACDYVYENDGLMVGFNKSQILDAVTGRKNCLLTMSSPTFDFVKDIKAAYGDFVTVIGTYIDPLQLEKMYRANRRISRKQRKVRLEIGRTVKRILLEERDSFDEILLYGGEDSLFNMEALGKQLELMIQKAELRERRMKDSAYVDLPYKGTKPYLFVSYSHADRLRVLPVLRLLQLAKCRVWYDDGIRAGENWRTTLATKIQSESCAGFILFSSRNAVNSLFVGEEVEIAIESGKKIITVRLDDAIFSYSIEKHLQAIQNLFPEDAYFEEKLIEGVDESVFTFR